MSDSKQSSSETDHTLNIIKCRDDAQPVLLSSVEPDTQGGQPRFSVRPGSTCSWAKPDAMFGPEKLRGRIEPWLTALCQSEHLSVLIGSGLSHAVHFLARGSTQAGMKMANFGAQDSLVAAEADRAAKRADREHGNIEDQLRAANELLRGLEILAVQDKSAEKKALDLEIVLEGVLSSFGESILAGEAGLISADQDKQENAFNYLVSFLMSFASRTGTRDRLHLFTTNYDRILEAGAEVAGLHLLDRFVGSLAPVFRSSRLDLDMHYNPPGIRGEPRYLEGVARFTKLHGSVDWIERGRSIRRIALPFGAQTIEPYLKASADADLPAMRLMIYPNASKDRETAEYPYVDLFRDFAAAVCRPNHTLVTYGYSFSDEHINRVVEDMLTIPSTHLVVIAYDDPLGRVMKMYDRLGRHAQVSLLIGCHLGDLSALVDNYLPKPAIDRTSFRMAELLKARWSTNQGSEQEKDDGAALPSPADL